MIEFHTNGVQIDLDEFPSLKKNISDIIVSEKRELGFMSIVYCSDDVLYEMNVAYLGHDSYTDIITFDFSTPDVLSGELYISIDRVKDNAHLFNVQWFQELYRVTFHGLLHLLGYNDKTLEDKVLMTEKENYYLSKFGLL